MKRLTVVFILLAGLTPLSALAQNKSANLKRFKIDLSTLETMKTQDWSGRAKIDKGTIAGVEKTSGGSDTINPDKSWTLVYGRSLKGNPKQPPTEKCLIVAVDAPDDAVLSFETKGGDFSFPLDEIPEDKAIEFLGGNVEVTLAANPDGGKKTGAKKAAKKQASPAADIAGELKSEPVTDGKSQSDWPVAACGPDGATWFAYVEWDGKSKDRVVVVRRGKDGAAGAPIVLDDGLWDHYWPAIVILGDAAIVVWSAQRDGNFDLYGATIAPGGKASKPERLTDTPYTDFHARMISDGKDAVTLVYQSFRDGQSDIYARRFTGGAWGFETRVSPSAQNDWQPAVALDGYGSAWISWDSYEHGNYDVFLRRFDAKGLGPVIPMTSEPSAQFHSSVAVDKDNRVWVAWDDGGLNWGKDKSASSTAPGNQGLHGARTIGLRLYADGAVQEPEAQPSSVFTGRMQKFAELPQLAVDGAGTLWMVFRHWTITRPTEMYHVYATKLTANGWAKPWRMANSSGKNTQWASIAPTPDGGLRVAWTSDGRAPDNLPKDQFHALIYRVHSTTLKKGEDMPPVQMAAVQLPEPETAFVRRVRPTLDVGGKTYTLIVGDCHRHTDIRGHSAVDGSVMDTFRYALDAGQLDYMGLGDHNEVAGGKWPDGLRDYQWWWTQKAVDLFTHAPTFIGVYSYEHSMSSPGGHRNILFLKRGAPLRPISRTVKDEVNPGNQPPELWKWVQANVLAMPGQKCVIVPHTFAAGPLAYWNWPNSEFDCLLEMYQGCRGSYERINLPAGEKRGRTQTTKEGHFAQDALAKGNVYGFVSFSDHGSTHNSWGCVWVDQVTREALFDAMLKRRTYAASDEIVLKVKAGADHTVGEKFTASVSSPVTLDIDVAAPDEIKRIDVVRNGEYVWTQKPTGKTFKAEYTDTGVKPGANYYYVRVFQRDPEKPDGDPEMAWSSPMFITYR